MSDAAIEAALRRDRVIVAAAVVVLTALAARRGPTGCSPWEGERDTVLCAF